MPGGWDVKTKQPRCVWKVCREIIKPAAGRKEEGLGKLAY